MENQGFKEKDWKLFRKKIPEWQEAYMERLCKEYAELLEGEGKASDRFWTLEKRIKTDKKRSGVICEMSRSEMMWIIMELFNDKAITISDLEEFSDEFKETFRMFVERRVGQY